MLEYEYISPLRRGVPAKLERGFEPGYKLDKPGLDKNPSPASRVLPLKREDNFIMLQMQRKRGCGVLYTIYRIQRRGYGTGNGFCG